MHVYVAVLARGVNVSELRRLGSCGGYFPGFQDTKTVFSPTAHPRYLGSLEFTPDTWPGDLAHFDRQRGDPDLPNFKCSLRAICAGFQTHNYCGPSRGASYDPISRV